MTEATVVLFELIMEPMMSVRDPVVIDAIARKAFGFLYGGRCVWNIKKL